MRSHFEVSPAEYEAGRQGHLQRRRVDLVAGEVAQTRPGDVVLEVGCGPGDVLAAVASINPDVFFVGLDIDERMIDHARRTHRAPNLRFECLGLGRQSAPVRARLVFGIDVVHHVHELESFVAAVAGALDPAGRWLVVEPNSRNPYIWLHQERMRRAGLDESHFPRVRFREAAANAGLRFVDCRTAFVVPGAVRAVPGILSRVERWCERVPVLGGSVVYRLASA